MTTGAAELLHETPTRVEIPARSPLALAWRRLRRDRVAMGGLVFIVVLLLVAVFAPLIVDLAGAPPYNRGDTEALDEFGTATGPSSDHLFGVEDRTGRDVFSRVVYGARVSLAVALAGTALSVLVGVMAGMLAGYYRGWVDTLLSRLMDVLLAFPILLLAVGVASACSIGGNQSCLGGLVEPGLGVVVLAIALTGWPYIGRIIRGQVLSLREREFVEAARATGASGRRILVAEILPNLAAPIVVYATLVIPQNVLFEAALSFLGVGAQDPTPSWGIMIADAAPSFDTAWWWMLFPGLALLLTVLAFSLLGDGLQDALDPRRKEARAA